jgi:hypothetical protein
MADPRTFTLIGEFKDGITPALQKINNSISSLKNNLSTLTTKKGGGYKDITKSVGSLVSAHKNLADSVGQSKKEIQSMTVALQAYRKEAGKAASATMAIKRMGTKSGQSEAKFWQQANQQALAYQKTLRSMGSAPRGRVPRTPPPGGGYVPPTPPTRGGGGGYTPPTTPTRGGGGYAAAVGGGILGNQVANVMTDAIVRGFQIGTSIMVKPFEYFSSKFGERVKDEIDDLKAAGGFYSIAKRQKDPFVKSLDEAIEFQQESNRVFAKMAAALPGVTHDYVQVSKRLGDTIARVVSKDMPDALKKANEIRATEEGRQFYGAPVEGTGAKAQQATIQTLLGEMTKKTVLAGLGGRAGAGGMMGPYGLPGLAERMISQEEISMGQMQRYAAIFGDPMIADALSRHIDKINATQKDSMERMAAFNTMIDEIVTPEYVNKLRTSFDGVYQSIKSAIDDPDTGIFGLGRQMQGLGKRLNSFGQYMDEFGNVVTNVNQAADVDLSLFEMLRDVFTQTGQVLAPIITSIVDIWDPLRNIGEALKDARHYTAEFARTFNNYREGLKQYAKDLGGQAQFDIMGSLDLRASLAAINNLFKQFGVYGKQAEQKFQEIAKKIMDPKADLGSLVSDMLKTFFDSDIAKKVGEFIGNLIGTVLKQVADATKYVAGIVEGGGFAGGFASAFQKSGGFQAIQDIFMSITQLFIKALITAITKMPLLSLTVVGLAALPAIIGAGITSLVERAFVACQGMMRGGACPMPGAPGNKGTRNRTANRGGLGAINAAEGGMFQTKTARQYQLRAMARARRAARKAAEVGQFGVEAAGLGYNVAGRPGSKMVGAVGKTIGKVGKFVPGGALAGGAIDMGLALASGENFGKAAAGAIGTVFGGTVGSIFGPVGTMIGMAAGGMIGDATADAITKLSAKGPSVEQLHAAEMQNEAAVKQLQAAKLQAGGLDPEQATYTFGTAQQFADRIKVLGLESDKAAMALKNMYGSRESASEAAKKAADELNAKIKALKDNKVPPDLIAKQVKPLQDQFNKAKANLERAQAAFDAQFRKTPGIIQQAITNSLSSLSFKNIETILGNKIAGIQIQAPSLAFTLPNPNAPNPYLPAPVPAPPNFEWKNKNPNNMSELYRQNAGNPQPEAKGALGDAIASEMRMKPPGSDLVIANSSETVIPAAGGLGMKAFMDTLAKGFSTINQQYIAVANGLNTNRADMEKGFQQSETKNNDRYNTTTQRINQFQEQTTKHLTGIDQNIASLTQKVATMSTMGGMFGGMGGGMDLGGGYGGAGVAIAGQLGNYIKATGGAPGSIWEHPMHGGVKGKHAAGSYHYSGRAIDIGAYANEQAGVIARIKAFNAKMGVKPVEFLHAGNDPNHQDHVHVAYNRGNMSPLMQELQAMPRGEKVGFANTSEMVANQDQTKLLAQALKMTQQPLPWVAKFINTVTGVVTKGMSSFEGSLREFAYQPAIEPALSPVTRMDQPPVYVTPPAGSMMNSRQMPPETVVNVGGITVNAEGVKDPDTIATMVVDKMWAAVTDARSSSIFM